MVAEAGTIEILDIERSGLNPLNDARGAATTVIGGTRLFATSSETQNQISIFSVDPVGGFSFVDGAALDGAYGLSFATVNGATFLVGAGRADDSLRSYAEDPGGSLTLADSVLDSGARSLDDQRGAPAVIKVEGTTYVIQSGYEDDGLTVFRLGNTGNFTQTDTLTDADAPPGEDHALDGVQALTAFEAHGQAYVAAAGNLADGIGLFALNASGELAFTDSMFDSDPDASGLQSPLAIAHATINGRTFLFTASDGTNAIASVEVKEGGSLEHQGNFLGAGTTGENLDLSVVQTGGLTFLLSTDRGHDTISAFLVDGAGRLQRIAQRTDTADPGSAHAGAFGVTGFAEDQRLFALVSAQEEDAITLFEIGALDGTIAEGNNDDILLGFGGNDTLSGLGGDDRLYGMAGADRLLGGNDDDRLFGGNGNDQLRGESGIDRLEGGAGADRLFGGDEADTLLGQTGSDILFGGLGADTSEQLFEYYLDRVTVEDSSTAMVTSLRVESFDPETAQAINTRLLEQSEVLVNELSERARTDSIAFSEGELTRARAAAQEASLALAAFRDSEGVIDPELQASAGLQMISKLQDQLIAAQTQLLQMETYTPRASQIPVLRTQVRTLEREIAEQTAQLAGGQRSLSATSARYQELLLASEFAERQLAAALLSYQEAQAEARRKQAYVERISDPSLPDYAEYPRRLRNVLATFILGLLAWGVVSMLLIGVREHRD